MSRRLMFYHYIINQDKKSLIYKFYKSQCRKTVKDDWCLTVQEDLETLEIKLTEEKIQKLSNVSFKKLVNTAIKKEAFKYLLNIKNSHRKVLHIPYKNLEMQDYLLPSNISSEMAKFTFLCRSRMLAVGANFKEGRKNPFCPVCKIVTVYDSQNHLMLCTKLNVNIVTIQQMPEYDDLFKSTLKKKMYVVKVLRENFQKRTKLTEKVQT